MVGVSRSAVVVGVSGVLAAGIVTGIAGWQTREIRAHDRADAAVRARTDTTRALSEVRLRLSVLAGAIAAQPVIYGSNVATSPVGIDADAFRRQASPVIAVPGFRAVLWAPRVGPGQLPAFTAATGVHPRPSSDPLRDQYPVAYAARTGAAADDRGVDLAAPGPAWTALHQALGTGRPQFAQPSGGGPGRGGMLLIVPVFGASGPRGVVAGVLEPDVLLSRALTDLPGAAQIVALDPDGSRTTILRRGRLPKDAAETAVGAFGQTWIVSVAVPPASRTDLLPVLALATMVLLLAAAAAFALVLSLLRRSRTVERLVTARTREAADARAAFEAAAAAVDEWLFTLRVQPDDELEMEFEGPGFERLAQLPPGSVAPGSTHTVWRSLVHPDDRAAHAELLRYEHLSSLVAVDHVYRLATAGEVRHVRERLVPLRAADGRLLVHGILSDITDVRAAAEEAERRSRTDPLTALANRRHVFDVYEVEVARAEREGTSIGFVMADVDRFKSFNDRYGHLAGDRILVELGRRLETTARGYDLVARWGGEEFCVLAPGVETEEALRGLAERVRRAVSAAPIDGHDVTVSVGAVRTTDVLRDIDAVADAADRALYSAKRRGRDQVRLYADLTVEDFVAEEPEAIRLAQALATAASVREGMPALHCQQVADLSAAVAAELGLSDAMVMRCRIGGWLHDVGKSVIPDQILGKRGDLTEDEWQVMRNHTVIGDEIVRRIAGLGEAAPAIRAHHERFDGTGYPDGLAGNAIPIEARIVAAADAYSAITSDRVYSRGRARAEAIVELRSVAGRHLDPAVVEALVAVLDHDAVRIGRALHSDAA
jgi:diguanylate cyclase (GGDEF)-like protein/putative nucleotidyltransferase with HDIG domain